MVVCNRSQTAIAAISWIWRFEPETGSPISWSVSTGGGTSLLAPFGLDDRTRKLYGYWHVILPGSKRAIHGMTMFGDNTDVRPPELGEHWRGSGFGAGVGSRRPPSRLKSVTLELDGVFFLDGGFAGPDTLRTFDRVTTEVEAHVVVGKIAHEGYTQGRSPMEIFAQIENVTGRDRGPAPPPPPQGSTGDPLSDSLRNLAYHIGIMRRHATGDGRVIELLMSWAETALPSFRKL
jgi:hypothetical protein